jgi:glutamyl-tRNA reductase
VSQDVPGAVIALTAHARQVPVAEREEFAERLHAGLGDRAVFVETCHRVEAYAIGRSTSDLVSTVAIPDGARVLTGEAAVRHAITVAVGRDSVVMGEDQVLHQVRVSIDTARAADALDPALERLFALALRAGRRARTWRPGPQRSLADLALAAIEQQAGTIRDREVLVVGAGRMGRLAAAAVARSGAVVAIANRSHAGAEALATATRGRVEAFDPGDAAGRFAGVVVALGGSWPLSPGTADAFAASSTVVVDLSVPAAVPPGLARRLGTRLVTADALALVPPEPEPAGGFTGRLDSLIDETSAAFDAWQAGHAGRRAADALVTRADREREAELAVLWRRLPELDPEARDAIERMTRHLAERLLRDPLERLGRDTTGTTEQAVRDLFAL